MSTTVDERIVSMQFDNKHFESNVQTSMSTLQKLKQALRLDGAAKGLETVQSAASKVNIAPLGAAVEGVKVKFDALGIMATTTLMNITNDAVNAGKRIANALTIEPIKSGFSEYELKMNSMQTIVSSTGESIDTVNKYLNELNEYSDKTIYSFADMTQNIGKFTNAGVKLEDAVAAIQGISNEAALSGANANEASRAMYNFAQALSAGHVKLIDWKSIENANMATVGFKEELIKTAVELGTLTEAGEGCYQTLEGNAMSATSNFNETLQDQWMTSDVLIKTLKKYSDETTDIGKAAFESATKVRTFTQMMDTLKESAQSGWARTWEIIFGSLEESKSLWTGISETVGGFIQKINDARNAVLEIALGVTKPFSGLADKISKVTGATEAMSKSTEELGDIVNRVIRGELGHGQARWDKLTEMGYDWAQVQNLVNEKLGSSVRHTSNLTDAQKDANKAQAENIEQLLKKTDAQLLEIGFTQDEIDALRNLQKQSEKTGIPVEELIKDMDKLNGRTLLINSFKNIGQGLAKVFRSIADAWKEIFPPKSTEEKAQSLYNLIASFHKLTSNFVMTDETADKLKRTFKGLFALVDIFTTITGGVLKVVLKTLCKLLGMADVDILSFTARIGDAIVKVRDWIDEHNILAWAIQKMIPYLKMAAKWFAEWFNKLKESGVFTKVASAIKKVAIAFKDWVVSLKDSKVFKTVVSYVKKMTGAFKEWIAGMKEADNIPKYIIQGLVNGLKAGVTAVIKAIAYVITSLINKARELLDIHSPSKVFFGIGEYIIMGLVNGIKKGISIIAKVIRLLVDKITDIFDEIDWDKVMALGISTSVIVFTAKILGIVKNVTDALFGWGHLLAACGDFIGDSTKSLNKVLTNFAKIEKAFAKVLKGMAFSMIANGVKSLVISIAIMVGALAVLAYMDHEKLKAALPILYQLVGMIAVLAIVVGLLNRTSVSLNKGEGLKMGVVTTSIAGIGLAFLAMAGVIKLLGGMNVEDLKKGFNAMAGMTLAMMAFIAVYGLLVKDDSAKYMARGGRMIRSLAVTMLLMIGVAKLANMMEWKEFAKAGVCLAVFTIMVRSLMAVSKTAEHEKIAHVGATMLAIAVALGILVGVAKLAGMVEWAEFGKLAVLAAGVWVFMLFMIDICKINKNEQAIVKLGGTILAIALALGTLAVVIKLLSTMEWEELIKGVIFMAPLVAFVTGLMMMSAICGKFDTANLGKTLMSIAVSIAILAGICVLLGVIDPGIVWKGIGAMTALVVFVAGLVAVTKLAKNCEKTIMNLAIAVGILAGIIIILSFIKPEKLIMPTLAMMGLMGMFAIMTQATKNVKKNYASLIVLGAVVVALAGILVALSFLNPKKAIPNAIALGVLMLSMVGMFKILNSMKVGKTILSKIWALTAMAVPLVAFAGVLTLASFAQNAITNAIALSLLMAAAVGILYAVEKIPLKANSLKDVAAAVIGLAAIAGPLYIFAQILSKMDTLENAKENAALLLATMGVALLLVVIMAELGKAATNNGASMIKLIPTFISMGILIAMIQTLVPVLKELSGLDWVELGKGLGAMAVALGIITVVGKILGSSAGSGANLAVASIGMVGISIALMMLVPVLQALGTIQLSSLIQGLVGMAGALAILAIAAMSMSELSVQIMLLSAGLGLFGLAMQQLVPPLQTLGTMSLSEIGTALLALAGILATIGIVAGVLGYVAGPGIMIFAGAIALLGAGALAAGVGISMLATGLTALATGASTIVPGLTALVTGLLPLIPVIITAIGNAILLLMQQVVTLAPVIATTIATVLLTILTTIATYLPAIIEAGMNIIMAILTGIKENIGQIAKTAIQITVNFINAVASKLGDIIAAGINLMVSFIEGMAAGISKNSERIRTAVSNLIKSIIVLAIDIVLGGVAGILKAGVSLIGGLIKGIASCVAKVVKAVGELISDAISGIKDTVKKWITAGKDLAQGLIDGIKAKMSEVAEAAKGLASAAKDKVCKWLGIASPSKEFIKIGKFVDEGFAKGLTKYANSVTRASAGLGNSALDGVRNTMSRIAEAVNTDVDSQPTIRPVLDLSNIKSGAGAIGGLFANPSLGVSANIGSISSMMSRRQNGTNDDIVSAINDLKSTIGNASGDSYTINGITYSEGSDVAEAIKTLTRAAKVGRRV